MTLASPAAQTDSFRPFCDSCGIKFEEGQLRPKSKFCASCGEELSPWLIKVMAARSGMKGSQSMPRPDTPPISPGVQIAPSTEDSGVKTPERGEDTDDSLPIIVPGTRGRGRGRPRGRGRGRGVTRGLNVPLPCDTY